MKRLLAPLVILVFAAPTFAQLSDTEIENLKTEKAALSELIDSLNTRLADIDLKLSQANPEERLNMLMKKYGKNKGKMIAQGKVWQTISYDMAIDSWGKPIDIKKTETSKGETQKWIYPDNKYLYFKNGRLESWRE